ncbi:hypothetical protein J7E91_29480 [Streptomyces sp. ISL-99]|nr:hypothetical protein [Streptomyces sp. ISL-99]
MCGAMYSEPGFPLRSVLYECDSGVAERFHGVILRQVTEPSNRLFCEVVRRGIDGGDVRPTLPPMIWCSTWSWA